MILQIRSRRSTKYPNRKLQPNVITESRRETHSTPSQTSKIELFTKIVNGWKFFTIFAKSSIVDVWLSSECASGNYMQWKLKLLSCKITSSTFFDSPELFRSSRQRCSIKKVFLEISQNSQENTCARVFF